MRFLFPRYEDAAKSVYDHQYGFSTRYPNSRARRIHPDTDKYHWVVYNSSGLRESREFTSPGRFRVGIFGDSFVENTSLPVEYGFPEVLDYLLNSNGDRFDVINFGMNGYGADESYLSFLRCPAARNLNYVFYVFCWNDLMDNFNHRLISLGPKNELIFNNPHPKHNFLSKLYLTYLFIEAKDDLQDKFDGVFLP
ncbi:MAG: SGNH/GDSL hydrolase family protein, partial [Candidatus Omnitrophica bacterium]|nr:SGNH/GDSL hydrolase family protein [Candidatus Omnitrophota bacterium]